MEFSPECTIRTRVISACFEPSWTTVVCEGRGATRMRKAISPMNSETFASSCSRGLRGFGHPITRVIRGYFLFLEFHFRCELDDPRIRGADDLTEAGSQRHTRHAEVGMIQSVKELCSELQSVALGNRKILRQIEIEAHHARSAK